jgi:hypothetical protein
LRNFSCLRWPNKNPFPDFFLLINGIFSREEFLEMVKVLGQEMKKERKG